MLNGPTSRAARLAGWAVGLVAVVVLVVVGSSTKPTSGTSDDRLYAIAGQLKCLQCAGESVAGSQADIAVKMREQIRAQMREGRTDDEILTSFADTYGDRVLLNPSGNGVSALVWVLPVVVIAAAALGLAFVFVRSRRQRDAAGSSAVSDEDRELVESALAASHGSAEPPVAQSDG